MSLMKSGLKRVSIVPIISFIQSMIKFVLTLYWQHYPEIELENEKNDVDKNDNERPATTGR